MVEPHEARSVAHSCPAARAGALRRTESPVGPDTGFGPACRQTRVPAEARPRRSSRRCQPTHLRRAGRLRGRASARRPEPERGPKVPSPFPGRTATSPPLAMGDAGLRRDRGRRWRPSPGIPGDPCDRRLERSVTVSQKNEYLTGASQGQVRLFVPVDVPDGSAMTPIPAAKPAGVRKLPSPFPRRMRAPGASGVGNEPTLTMRSAFLSPSKSPTATERGRAGIDAADDRRVPSPFQGAPRLPRPADRSKEPAGSCSRGSR